MGYWKYKIIHDYNATNLINDFREENLELKNSKGTEDNLLDFIIYAEKDDFTISLGKVLLIKMSENMVNYFHEYKGSVKLQNYWAKFIYEENKDNKTFQFNENEIADAFLESILLQSKIGDFSPIEMNHFIKNLTDEFSDFLHHDIKFSREQWDPSLKSEKYLFNIYNKNVFYLSERIDLFIKKLKHYQKYISKIKELQKINNLISSIINGLQKLKYTLSEITEESEIDIAFFCGIWNGTVEFIAGIIDLILLLLNLLGNDINNLTAMLNNQKISNLYTNQNTPPNLEVLTLVEGIEEVLSAFIKNPEELIDGAIEGIKNYAKYRYTVPNLTDYQLAYHTGEDTILAIDIVFTIVTIVKGIAKLAKKIPKFVKWVENLITKEGKGGRKVLNTLLKLEKVPYGESDLSKIAIQFRKTLPKPKHGGNIAVFEYYDNLGKIRRKEFTTFKGNKDHAEIIGMKWLKKSGIPNKNVIRVYSELEPCGLTESMCKQKLQRYKNAKIEYSYDYPGNENTGANIRRASKKERKKDFRKYIK